VSRGDLRQAGLLCATRRVSQAVREIFQRHTEMVEPLSLDEAYLDVTENKIGLPTATRVAKVIREQIQDELNLTASAGVAPKTSFSPRLRPIGRSPTGFLLFSRMRYKHFCFLSLGKAQKNG
jgi:DNA polymerase IV